MIDSRYSLKTKNNDTDDAVIVRDLSKQFRIPHERKTTLFQHMAGLIGGGSYSYEVFDALKNISFTVKHGETFGVIGPNGSGKSTLLKILAGVLYPDSGTATINGKIAPFLELGVGFQLDLTAKENIYLYGAIMGLTKREIALKYEEILEFSELKRFENMKLKNFSSGMTVRLAFSTAIQTDPDILLVDEVLAVGDESFKSKCNEKIDEIRRDGKTILIVSHELQEVEEMCDRCILIKNGTIHSSGEPREVIRDYKRISSKKKNSSKGSESHRKAIPFRSFSDSSRCPQRASHRRSKFHSHRR